MNKTLDLFTIQEIEWIDITNNELAKKETSRNSKELLRRLHVKENEKVIEGAEAFLALWKKMPSTNCSTTVHISIPSGISIKIPIGGISVIMVNDLQHPLIALTSA